jgi:hypothetical protein
MKKLFIFDLINCSAYIASYNQNAFDSAEAYLYNRGYDLNNIEWIEANEINVSLSVITSISFDTKEERKRKSEEQRMLAILEIQQDLDEEEQNPI